MGNSKMIYADSGSVKAELKKIKNKGDRLVLKVPETFKEQKFDQLLAPFREAGILKLSISYY